MKTLTSNKSIQQRPKVILFAVIVIFGLLVGAMYWIKTGGVTQKQSYSTTGDASQKGTTKKTTSSDSINAASPSTGNSIVTNNTPQPASNEIYPITNEHYQIQKTSNDEFLITLYPIINSPSQQEEYTAQLKQFKQEVISYLATRYGPIASLKLSWNPEVAENL